MRVLSHITLIGALLALAACADTTHLILLPDGSVHQVSVTKDLDYWGASTTTVTHNECAPTGEQDTSGKPVLNGAGKPKLACSAGVFQNYHDHGLAGEVVDAAGMIGTGFALRPPKTNINSPTTLTQGSPSATGGAASAQAEAEANARASILFNAWLNARASADSQSPAHKRW